MKEMSAQFLKLLFEPGETISVSHNKYGYHSVEQSALNGPIELLSPNPDIKPTTISEDDINMISINPISGYRRDPNVTAFRSFMMEIDNGTLPEQKKYMEESGIPFSACVFSGNKSLHYAIVLEKPLPDIHQWRFYNQWILNILKETDQQNKNPSRNLRFPGNRRKNGKKLIQSMVEMKGRVKEADFFAWLSKHEGAEPVQRVAQIPTELIQGVPTLARLPADVIVQLDRGVNDMRNATWFYIGCRFAEKGFGFDHAVSELERYFQEEQSFGRREWLGCLTSAYKRVHGASHV